MLSLGHYRGRSCAKVLRGASFLSDDDPGQSGSPRVEYVPWGVPARRALRMVSGGRWGGAGCVDAQAAKREHLREKLKESNHISVRPLSGGRGRRCKVRPVRDVKGKEGSSTTEAQLGLAIEFTWEIEWWTFLTFGCVRSPLRSGRRVWQQGRSRGRLAAPAICNISSDKEKRTREQHTCEWKRVLGLTVFQRVCGWEWHFP